MKDLNIVYINYLLKKDVLSSIETLLKDLEQCNYDVAITLVDNSCNQDGLKEELEIKFPTVHYINPGVNLGFGQGNRVGFENTPARYYMALNCDTLISENSQVIAKMINFMDENQKIGCVGPKTLNMDGSLQYTCYRFDLPSIFIKPLKQINFDKKYQWVKKHADKLEMRDFDHNETRPVDWVLGAAMMVRDEVVKEIGWFDERYFMYMEDCDWCHTMWEHGWSVYYLHDAVIHHIHNRDSAKVPGLFKALIKNKLARIHLMSWLKYIWKWRKNHKYYANIS